MDWQFISRHLISGSFPVLIILVLYFIILHLVGKKHTLSHIIVSFVFCFYLIGILTTTGVYIRGTFSPRISYIPFVDMIRGPIDTTLNILLFIPMGFFLPILYEKFDRIGKIVLAGLLISLSVEITQMFGYGATDINDLITNTVGACLGYGIYKLLCRFIPKSWINHIRADGNQCYFELMLFWICTLLIMITIQPYIYDLLFKTKIPDGEIQLWK